MTELGSVIYDLGANRGNNLPYYLSRAQKVVAVEGNPRLAEEIRSTFSAEIISGRLVVYGCVLSRESSQSIPFYIHRVDNHLSCLNLPACANTLDFEMVEVPSRSVVEIINAEGEPMYIKVDLEGADSMILEQLFAAEIYPDFLSVELQSLLPLALVFQTERYHSFQLMDARRFSKLPQPEGEDAAALTEKFIFDEDTAGPFGPDIPYPWMDREQALRNLSIQGVGWRDLHARKTGAESGSRVWLEYFPTRSLLGALARKMLRKTPGPN